MSQFGHPAGKNIGSQLKFAGPLALSDPIATKMCVYVCDACTFNGNFYYKKII